MYLNIDFLIAKDLRYKRLPGGGEKMNRNVSIIVVLLVLVVIAGYLIWLRSKVATIATPVVEQTAQVTPVSTATPVISASPSATPKVKEATGSTKTKSATGSSVKK